MSSLANPAESRRRAIAALATARSGECAVQPAFVVLRIHGNSFISPVVKLSITMPVLKEKATKPSWSDGRIALLIFAAAVFLRLIYLVEIQSVPFISHLGLDAASYDRTAQRIAAGDWLGRDVFYQEPLYPYFLGVIYAVFGRHLNLVRFIQLLVGAGNCVLVFWIARRLFDRKTALCAGVLALTYGLLVFYDGAIGKDGLSVFLGDLALLGLLAALQRPRWYRWLWAGVVLGLAILTRGNLLVVLPFLMFWVAVVFRPLSLKGAIGAFGALLVGIALSLLPVTYRNYLVGDDFVLTTSQGGQNFYIGNNPRASGFFENPERIRLNPEFEEADFKAEALRRTQRRSMKPSEISSFWFQEGIRFIHSNPRRASQLLAKKAAMFWNHFEIPDNYNYYYFRQEVAILRVLSLGFAVVAPFGLLGLFLARNNRKAWLGPVFTLGYMVSIVPFHMASRYRLPIVPVLVVFAAYSLVRVHEMVRRKTFKVLGFSLIAVAAAAVFVNLRIVDQHAVFKTPYTELGIAALEDGRGQEAIEYFSKALELDPGYAPAHYNMGNAFSRQGDYEKAAEAYKKALRADPEFLMAYDNLGTSCIRLGRFEEALGIFKQALTLRPDFAEALIGMGVAYHAMGRYDAAVEAYRQAIAVKPDSGRAHYNLACAYAKSGRVEEARQSLEKAIELNAEYKEKARIDEDLDVLRLEGGDHPSK